MEVRYDADLAKINNKFCVIQKLLLSLQKQKRM